MKTLLWLTAKAVITLMHARADALEHESRKCITSDPRTSDPDLSESLRNCAGFAREAANTLYDQLADFERDHLTSPKDRGKYFVAGHTKEV
jgi:hypothetical protein